MATFKINKLRNTPTNPQLITYLLKARRGEDLRSGRFTYSIKFNTIIPPANICDTRLLVRNLGTNHGTVGGGGRLLIKQSYMLMTWAAYIVNNNTTLSKTALRPRCAHLPAKHTRFTATKAPMAHKTFSQEQYQYKHHSLIVSFDSKLTSSRKLIPSINESIYLKLLLRQSISKVNLGTNLFLMSRLSINQDIIDKEFWVRKL